MSHKPSKSEKAASSTSRREEFERVFGPMLRAMRSWAFNEGIALHPRHVEGLALTYVTLMREAARTGDDLGPSLGRTLEDLDQLTRNIQDSVMAIRAQPVKAVLQRML